MKNKDTKLRIISSFVVAPFAVLGFSELLCADCPRFRGNIDRIIRVYKIQHRRSKAYGSEAGYSPYNYYHFSFLRVFYWKRIRLINKVDFRPESVFVLSFIGNKHSHNRQLKRFQFSSAFYIEFHSGTFLGSDSIYLFFYQIYLSFGGAVALLVLTCVWFFDIGAYVVGMKFGRIRISPNYSPKKSLEGSFLGE